MGASVRARIGNRLVRAGVTTIAVSPDGLKGRSGALRLQDDFQLGCGASDPGSRCAWPG